MSPIIVLLCFIFLIIYLYKYVTYKPTENYPPGPIRLPIFGSYLQVLLHDYRFPHEAFIKMSKKYKSRIIGFYMGGFNAIVANDHESCKEIFTKSEFQGRLEAFPVQFRMNGKKLGIFADDSLSWLYTKRFALREMRDLGFGRRSENYERILEEETKDLIEAIKMKCDKGESVLVPETFFPPLFNCIFYILTGSRVPFPERRKLEKFGSTALKFITSTNPTGCMLGVIPWIRHLFPEMSGFKGLRESSEVFDNLMKKAFKEHEATLDENAVRDMVDVFLKNKGLYPHFTEEQFLITVIDFIFPNSAIGAVLAWGIIYLILHPQVQRKCREEIDSVVGRERMPGLDDRDNLPYVMATLKEVMRRQTLTPLAIGHRATEDTKFFGYDIPKDTFVIPNLWAMHMDEKIWGDPENFRPERFILEDGTCDKKNFTLPFGIGKRVCAGETFSRTNLFVLMTALLQNFSWESDTEIDFSKNRSGVSIVPQPDLYVRFHYRN